MPKRNFKIKNGYTIIETMIAVSLFVIVVMMGMGALINANLLHQKSQSMRSILDNLNFIMDDMGKNLRTGYTYRCISLNNDLLIGNIAISKSGPSCWGVAFETATGNAGSPNDQWVYYAGTNGGGNTGIFKSVDGGTSFVQLTPDEVTIDTAASGISVLGAENTASGDQQQPFATIRLVGTITLRNITTPFSLQTSVSQRQIDI